MSKNCKIIRSWKVDQTLETGQDYPSQTVLNLCYKLRIGKQGTSSWNRPSERRCNTFQISWIFFFILRIKKSKGYLFTSSNPPIRLSLRLMFLFDNNENDKLQLFGKIEDFQRMREPNAFDKPFHQTDLDDKSTDCTFDGNDFSNKPLN